MLRKLKDHLKFFRLFNVALCCLGLLFGYFILEKQITISWNIIYSLISLGFLVSAGFIVNDYYDIEIDKKNRPDRALPSGKVSKKGALFFMILFFILANAISLLVNWVYFGIILINSAVLYSYSRWFSKNKFYGNIIMALSVFQLIAIPGLVYFNIPLQILLIAMFMFFIMYSREVYKDIVDVKGDSFSRITLPTRFGVKKSAWIAANSLWTAAVIFFIAARYNPSGWVMTSVLISFSIVLAILPVIYLWNNVPQKFKFHTRFLKIFQVVCLATYMLTYVY